MLAFFSQSIHLISDFLYPTNDVTNEELDVAAFQNEILKYASTREIIVRAASKEGILFQFTVTVLTFPTKKGVIEQERAHTILQFSSIKEVETSSMEQEAISRIMEYAKSLKNSDFKVHYQVLRVNIHHTKIKKDGDQAYRQRESVVYKDLSYLLEGLFLRGYEINAFYYNEIPIHESYHNLIDMLKN